MAKIPRKAMFLDIAYTGQAFLMVLFDVAKWTLKELHFYYA